MRVFSLSFRMWLACIEAFFLAITFDLDGACRTVRDEWVAR